MKNKTLLLFSFSFLFSCGFNQEEKKSITRGKEVYVTNCVSCHQPEGKGIPGIYPSLIKPDKIIDAQTQRAVLLMKNGSGYDGGMRPISLTNEEIADVINYIQNSWDNKAEIVLQQHIDSLINL